VFALLIATRFTDPIVSLPHYQFAGDRLKQVLDTIDEVKRNPEHVPMRDFDDDAETMLIRNRKGGSQ
jgi:hypothetical protein